MRVNETSTWLEPILPSPNAGWVSHFGTSGRVDKCMGTRGSMILMVSIDASLPQIQYGL